MKKTYNRNHILVFGGAYSNLQAVERLKEISDFLGFDASRIICTGDVAGYCAQPEETVQFVKNWGINVLAGNVEVQLREGKIDCGCNFEEGSRCDMFSRSWFPFTQQNLSKDSIAWMQTLSTYEERSQNGIAFSLIHGGKEDVSQFIFKSTPIEVKNQIFDEVKSDIILCGHSGIPFYQKIENKLWVNAGVIGMPANDGTNRCWFSIVDLETKEVEQHAFTYNHNLASKLMVDNGLPNEYAFTLYSGKWDNNDILPELETAQQGFALEADVMWDRVEQLV